jgi:glycosyltransferase XagB
MTTTSGPEEMADTAARAERLAVSQLLLASGLVSEGDLALATTESELTGDPLGDVLVAHRAITEDVLVAVLGEVHQLQRIDLADLIPDPAIAASLPEPLARGHQALPLAVTDAGVLLAVARPLDEDALAEVTEALGGPVRQLLANRSDLDQLLQYTHRERYSDLARNALIESSPEISGHIVTTTAQKTVLVLAALAAVAALAVWTMVTLTVLVGLASLVYLLVSGYRLRLTLRSLGRRLETDISPAELAAVDPRTLPVFTILVPLYKEGGVVRRLVRGLDALDYPRTRLDVKLLCEEDDVETIEVIRSLRLPPHFHLVVVPDALPKTKPKACNYGLQLATGKYCVIFDAEDRPDPDQLKKAVIAFDRVDANVVCIQAKLHYFNAHQNLLTAWFANEYSMHFELVLPALAAAKAPIPLGGTSNHFRTDALVELGGWDPFNVTEDADLGIRLHRQGYATAVIDSTTLEEANSAVPNWVRQRSRWNKGYVLTWLVHLRRPLRLLAEVGPRDFLSFNLTLGSVFVLLLNPIFWGLTTLYVLTRAHFIQQMFPSVIYYMASAMLLVGNFSFLYLNVAGSMQRGQFGLTRTALLSPLYWGLMSWAAWKGFLQLFTNPFYWEKTEHGLDEGETP